MKIFLVRHGFNDFEKGEQSIGKQQAEAAGAFLAGLGLDLTKTLVLTSPLPRAVITGQLILQKLGIATIAPQAFWLVNDEGPVAMRRHLADFLANHPIQENIIAVSHEPVIKGWTKTYDSVSNGSIFLIDDQTQRAKRIFKP